MTKEVTLTTDTFKALAGEKRVQILKELIQRRKTQSELAQKLGLSAPTVAEHLSLLEKAGLVYGIDEGRKWKYFALTEKGREILQPGESRILILLATSFLAFIGAIYYLFSRFWLTTQNAPVLNTGEMLKNYAPAAAPLADGTGGAITEAMSQGVENCATATPFTSVPGYTAPELLAFLLVILVFGLLLGYYLHYRRYQISDN